MAARKVELERSLEDRCVERVEALGGLALKLRIEGVRGFPDRTVILKHGAVFAVEFKRPRGGRTALQQEHWRSQLAARHVYTHFVKNDEEFQAVLEQYL